MSLQSFMGETVYVASVTGVDAYGKATYETPRAISARVEPRRMMVRNARGEEAVSNFRIYSLVPVLLTDRLWMPGADSAVAEDSNVPISVSTSKDMRGLRALYRTDV